MPDEAFSTPATCGVAGTLVKTCVCGMQDEEVIPPTGEHVPATTWSGDDDDHYHACTVCSAKLDAVKHTYDDGVEEGVSATSCKDGKKTYTCSVCDYKKVVAVASGVPHTIEYILNIPERTMVQHCSACNADLAVLTNHFIYDFENMEEGSRFSPNANTVKSVVKNLNGNLCGFLYDDVDSIHGNNTPSPMISPADPTIRDLNILTLRWMPIWTDEDGVEHKAPSLVVNGKYKKTGQDDTWGGFGNTGLNSDGTIKLADWNSSVIAEADKWYTLIYAYTKADDTLTCTVVEENGHIESGIGVCGSAFATADAWAYFTVTMNDDGKGAYIDDIAFFSADFAKTEQHVHTWNDGTVTKAPTCVPGEKTYTCTACGATKKEDITDGMIAHDVGEWLTDEDSETHWHECARCGNKVDEEEHTWVEDTDKYVAPGTLTEGKRVYDCKCGKHKEEILQPEHHAAAEWTTDEENHWHECTDEGCDAKLDFAAHEWTVKSNTATCTEGGTVTYVCACGREKTEDIAALGHQWMFTADSQNKTLSHSCARCGETGNLTFTCDENYFQDFEKYEDGATITTTGASNITAKAENGNKYMSMDSTSGAAVFNAEIYKKPIADYMAMSAKFRFDTLDGDGALVIDFNISWKWDFGISGTPVTVHDGQNIKIGNTDTGLLLDRTTWYTITYVYEKATAALTVVISDESGNTAIINSKGKAPINISDPTWNYWHIKAMPAGKGVVSVDDVMIFYASNPTA